MNRPCFLPWFCRRSNRRREPSRSLRQPGRRTLEAPAPWEWRMNMIVETADDDHCYSPIGACWLQGKGRDIPHSLQRCRNPDINNNFIIITNNNIDSFNNIIVMSSPKVFLILFLQTLSDDECMLLRWCSPPQVTVTQARPRVAPPRAQPSSSFPGLCVYTQVRLLHTFSFF